MPGILPKARRNAESTTLARGRIDETSKCGEKESHLMDKTGGRTSTAKSMVHEAKSNLPDLNSEDSENSDCSGDHIVINTIKVRGNGNVTKQNIMNKSDKIVRRETEKYRFYAATEEEIKVAKKECEKLIQKTWEEEQPKMKKIWEDVHADAVTNSKLSPLTQNR